VKIWYKCVVTRETPLPVSISTSSGSGFIALWATWRFRIPWVVGVGASPTTLRRVQPDSRCGLEMLSFSSRGGRLETTFWISDTLCVGRGIWLARHAGGRDRCLDRTLLEGTRLYCGGGSCLCNDVDRRSAHSWTSSFNLVTCLRNSFISAVVGASDAFSASLSRSSERLRRNLMSPFVNLRSCWILVRLCSRECFRLITRSWSALETTPSSDENVMTKLDCTR